MKALVFVIVVLAAVTLGIVIARNQPSADQEAIEYRQALMTVVAGVTDPLFGMQRGQLAYDDALVRRHAAELPVLSGMVSEAFARDTRAASHAPTDALPYVWSDAAAFSKAEQSFADACAALLHAAQSGDQGQVRAASLSLDSACAQCHREFRAR